MPLAPPAEAEAYLAKNEELEREARRAARKDRAPSRSRIAIGWSWRSSRPASPTPSTRPRPSPRPSARPASSCWRLRCSRRSTRRPPRSTRRCRRASSPPSATLSRRAGRAREGATARRCRWPRSPPTATIVSLRSAKATRSSAVPKCRIPPPFPGSYLHKGPDRYEVPPSYFLIRGDVESRGPQMKPGFVQVADLRESTDRDPATRWRARRGGVWRWRRWIGSPQNPLTARVIVNRLWQKHFGRGIVVDARELRQDGRAADASGAPRLAGRRVHERRLAASRRINKLMMMSEAYQMASSFDERGRRARRSREPLPVAVPAAAARGRDRARHHARGRRQHQSRQSAASRSSRSSRRTSSPGSSAASGRTRQKARRRGGAASTSTGGDRCPTRCSTRSIIPDMNVVAGAQKCLHGADAGADAVEQSVRAVAGRAAGGTRQPRDARLADARSIWPIASRSDDRRRGRSWPIALDLIAKQSLASFTHVLLNLDEFMYMR